MGGRYTFDGTTWVAVEGWVDPAVLQAEMDAEREALEG
jgi:hypothetical protein